MSLFARFRKDRANPVTTDVADRDVVLTHVTIGGTPVSYSTYGPTWARAMDLMPGIALPDGTTVVAVRVGEGGDVDPSALPVDRSAGRHCTVCDRHGSHHTDRHDEFMTAAITVQASPDAAPVTTYLPGTEMVRVGIAAVPA